MTNTCMKDIIAGPLDEKSAIAVAAALTMKKGMLPHQMRTTPFKLSPPVSKPPAIADAFKKKRKEKKLPMELSVTPERAQAIQQAMAETEAACRDVEGLCKGAKGSEKPGHRYISRKPIAGGKFAYEYTDRPKLAVLREKLRAAKAEYESADRAIDAAVRQFGRGSPQDERARCKADRAYNRMSSLEVRHDNVREASYWKKNLAHLEGK